MTSVPDNSNTTVTGTESVLQLLQAVRTGDADKYGSAGSTPQADTAPPDEEQITGEELREQDSKTAEPEIPNNEESAVPEESIEERPFTAAAAGDNSIAGFTFNYPEEEEKVRRRRRKDHYRIKYADNRKRRIFPFILLGLALVCLCTSARLWYTDGHDNTIKKMIWPDWRPDDYVVPDVTPFEDRGLRVDLNPTVEATIKFRRQTQTYTLMQGAKVKDVVNICGIKLGEEDYYEPDGETVLSGGEVITVHRTTYVERVVTGLTVPYTNIERHTPLLSKGKTRVISYGRDGEAEQLYRDKYLDDELVETELVSETVTKEPVSGVIRVGDPSASLSYIDGSRYTDIQIVNGVPAQYERKISSGKCTAYSYPSGVYGGSGMYLFQGCVAVNPYDIPLGSLLYITSSDNSFVWGWAIAADSCEAAMYGINGVTVDCFLETYNDSLLFGAHWLDIYVVKQLHQSDLSQYIAKDGMFRARIPE